MSKSYFLLFCFLLSCRQFSTSSSERNQIIAIVMADQESNSLNLNSRCIIDGKYRVYNTYNDTLYLSDQVAKLISGFREKDVMEQYRNEYLRNKEIDFDTVNFLTVKRIIHFNNKSLCSVSFSRPIMYKNYYLLNVDFNDWASGKRILYVLKAKSSGNLHIVFQELVSVN